MSDAVVVGSGPNGLAAAVVLARAGLGVTVLEAASEIGGGTRSLELTVPGVVHDLCSAIHPLGVRSPCFRDLGLERHGLEWLWPEVDLAHPLDGGDAAVMVRSIDETAAGLGDDGPAWRRLFAPLAAGFEALADDVLRPMIRPPSHPVVTGRFGVRAAQPAAVCARRWKGVPARALFAGAAAHIYRPLSVPMSSAVGLLLIAAGHHHGWPVARGGSRAVADALAVRLTELGGRIETGVRVGSLDQLPPADVVLFDLAPRQVASIAGKRLPSRVRRAYQRYRLGPGAFKVDLAVEGGVPWTNEACRRAGTIHLGGTFEEIAHAEREVVRGRMPERPFVLVAQQYLADPSRSAGDVHPVWAYAHVPNGYPGDATTAILAQMERYAPGLRDRIVAAASRSTGDIAAENPNYLGGDIANGANTLRQILFRPRPALDPYATGADGLFLCSAATPPGAGVHGMCGANAAASALRWLERGPVRE